MMRLVFILAYAQYPNHSTADHEGTAVIHGVYSTPDKAREYALKMMQDVMEAEDPDGFEAGPDGEMSLPDTDDWTSHEFGERGEFTILPFNMDQNGGHTLL